ncbi:MAG: LysE family transporter [Ignavibacteria bacterium]
MELTLLFKGIIIGFTMAVPVGPIGIICIRKTLTEGRLRGLVIGLGAATADFLYGCVAAFGLTVISGALAEHQTQIRLTGGILLLFLGIKTFRARPSSIRDNPAETYSIISSYLSAVFLTLTNPLTIFAFITLFAALGFGGRLGYFSASALVIGVFAGSSLWFFLLSSGVQLLRAKFDYTSMLRVNRIAGILIIVSGFIAIASIL